MVGRDTLQPADGDGLAVQTPAPAGRLAWTIASAPQNGREHVRFAIEHVGVGKTPLRDQADIFRNVRVGRARPLAVDNFMVISWIVRVGAVQTCASSCLPTWPLRTALHCSDNVTMLARTLFDAQRAAFRRSALSYRDRMDALRKLEGALLDNKDEMVRAISDDFNGRAAEETLALELVPVLGEIRDARKHLKEWMEPRDVQLGWQFLPASARIEMQPKGVVGILGAWNYPLFLTIGPAVGAIAAGNRVMIKPSELAPRSAALLEQIVEKTFPSDYVAVINGGADVAQEFSSLPFDHLLFTGSTRVGKLVMKAAAENLTPVTLELGGKSPALVHPDYPLKRAAERILTGKLYNAGQTCVAPDYLLIARSRLEEFLTVAPGVVKKMYPKLVGNPDYTRIIDAAHYRTLANHIKDAQDKGAKAIHINPAGETCNEENRVFPPTLLVNVNDD